MRPPTRLTMLACAVLVGCQLVAPGEVEDLFATVDADADGWGAAEDCDDTDPEINPGAQEILLNGKDDDCQGADVPITESVSRAPTSAPLAEVSVLDVDGIPSASLAWASTTCTASDGVSRDGCLGIRSWDPGEGTAATADERLDTTGDPDELVEFSWRTRASANIASIGSLLSRGVGETRAHLLEYDPNANLIRESVIPLSDGPDEASWHHDAHFVTGVTSSVWVACSDAGDITLIDLEGAEAVVMRGEVEATVCGIGTTSDTLLLGTSGDGVLRYTSGAALGSIASTSPIVLEKELWRSGDGAPLREVSANTVAYIDANDGVPGFLLLRLDDRLVVLQTVEKLAEEEGEYFLSETTERDVLPLPASSDAARFIAADLTLTKQPGEADSVAWLCGVTDTGEVHLARMSGGDTWSEPLDLQGETATDCSVDVVADLWLVVAIPTQSGIRVAQGLIQ